MPDNNSEKEGVVVDGSGDSNEAFIKIGPFTLNKPAVILIASLAMGTGGITGYNTISEPVPDRHTGKERDEDIADRIAGDQAEARKREAMEFRLSSRISAVEAAMAKFREYRENHRVETKDGFNKIDECKRDLGRLERQIDGMRDRH